MLNLLFKNGSQLITLLGLLFAFAAVFWLLMNKRDLLPRDHGREFAVQGALSAGKWTSAGIIMIPVFIISSLIFGKVSVETLIYYVLLAGAMITGYLDDAARVPWGRLKKGLFDFAVALAASVTYVYFNGSAVTLAVFGITITLPAIIYVILGIVLIWVSINVTNCSDGVDGLSASLAIVTMASFFLMNTIHDDISGFNAEILLFGVCLVAYLWFNATPSILMMGDAGSRAMGFFIAIIAMKSGSPLIYIPFAIVLILDGGLGLIKLSFIKFLKINIMMNITLPLHDQVRKNMELTDAEGNVIRKNWSNTQTVFRFLIVQVMVSLIFIFLIW